jgi:hypothetical protein
MSMSERYIKSSGDAVNLDSVCAIKYTPPTVADIRVCSPRVLSDQHGNNILSSQFICSVAFSLEQCVRLSFSMTSCTRNANIVSCGPKTSQSATTLVFGEAPTTVMTCLC